MLPFTIVSSYNDTTVKRKSSLSKTELYETLREYSHEWESLIRTNSTPLSPIPTSMSPHLPSLPKIKAVLFDVYGTLLISGSGEVGSAADTKHPTDKGVPPSGQSETQFDAPPQQDLRPQELPPQQGLPQQDLLFFQAFSKAEVQITIPASSFNELCTKLYTEAIQQTHRDLKSRGNTYPEVDILEIWHSIWKTLTQREAVSTTLTAYKLIQVAFLYELSSNPTWPMPKACKTLKTISQGGYSLGIVSNAQFYTPYIFSVLCDESLAALGFDRQALVWSYQLKEAKPSVQLFSSVLSYYHTDKTIYPEEILYVGNDMLNDIHTAASAGCKTALFAGDQRSLRMRKENSLVQSDRADAILTDISQLKHILVLG